MKKILLAAAVVSGLAVPASIAAVGLSAPAFAASGVQCAKIGGTITSTMTISKCTPKSKLFKSASAPATSLAGGGTLTWAPGGQTTTVSLSVTPLGQGGCAHNWSEFDVNGSVTADTSGYVQVGDAVSARACVQNKGGKMKLVAGTTAAQGPVRPCGAPEYTPAWCGGTHQEDQVAGGWHPRLPPSHQPTSASLRCYHLS